MWPFCQSTSAPLLPLVEPVAAAACLDCSGQEAASSAASFTSIPSESAAITESLWVLMAASGCVYVTVCGCVRVGVWLWCDVMCLYACVRECNWTRRLQLCCSVLDSMGGAESYRVSVSCVGSPASVHGLDNVPAPQSQKNRSCRINSTSCPWWHFLMQFTQMAFLSVVLQV